MFSIFLVRPWLALFITNFSQLRQDHLLQIQAMDGTTDAFQTSQESISERDEKRPESPILSLPNEVLFKICSHLEAEHLSSLAQVCTRLLEQGYCPLHWQRIACRMWPVETAWKLELKMYKYQSYKNLCTLRCRVRTSGLYILRHQFAKTATQGMSYEMHAPVFLVRYYRMLRFYCDGSVACLTTSNEPEKEYKRVRCGGKEGIGDGEASSSTGGGYIRQGSFSVNEDCREVLVKLPMTQSGCPGMIIGSQIMRLKIEETNLGACNRLRFMEHYAVIQEGDIVRYREEGGGKAFRFVALAGFCKRVKREFPRDDEFDLAALFEMKKRDRQKGDWGGKRNVRGIVTGMEDGLR